MTQATAFLRSVRGSKSAARRVVSLLSPIAFLFLVSASGTHAATWTPLKNLAPTPNGVGFMIQSVDGRIFVQDYPDGQTWAALTPDPFGNYVNGSWMTLPSAPTARLFFADQILPNGNLFIAGGEFAGPGLPGVSSPTGNIFNPFTNTWSAITPFPLQTLGDAPSVLLQGGNVLVGHPFSNQTWIYRSSTDSWTQSGSKFYSSNGEINDEEGWNKLANGTVLTYDIRQSLATGGSYAEVYNPSTGIWSSISPSDGTANGFIPQLSLGLELGPQLRLQDGRDFLVGATQHTALYNPATNTWSAGPDTSGMLHGIPSPFGADDAPAAILPNGHVIFAADAAPSGFTSSGNITAGSNVITNIPSTLIMYPNWGVTDNNIGIPDSTTITSVDSPSQVHISQSATKTITGDAISWGGALASNPTQIFDFNPTTNTISPVSPPIPDINLVNDRSFITRMLTLPTGQILFADSTKQLWVYTGDGAPNPASRPVINDFTYTGSPSVFTLTGQRLNGQSAGSAYGDDSQNDDNYPIVRLTDRSEHVYYCTTTNWSSTSVDGGTTPETVTVTLNPAITPGNYSMVVSGAGISSFPVAVSITATQLP